MASARARTRAQPLRGSTRCPWALVAVLRMWDKRQRGYRAMGYRIEADAVPYESLL